MAVQQNLFESDQSLPDPDDLPPAIMPPLAVPCAWRNRRNEPCQRLAHRPLRCEGRQMRADGRPLLHCEIACFNGQSAEVPGAPIADQIATDGGTERGAIIDCGSGVF